MFESLSDRLSAALSGLRSKGKVTEADVNTVSREIRLALLEADVSLPVVRGFIKRIKERALGVEVSKALNPAEQVIKIVNEELTTILGGETRRMNVSKKPPTVIMLAGLQGAGKTTLAGKLAYSLKEQGHTPILVACDLQRPGAVQQLQIVGERAGVPTFAPDPEPRWIPWSTRWAPPMGIRSRLLGQALRRPARKNTTTLLWTPPVGWVLMKPS